MSNSNLKRNMCKTALLLRVPTAHPPSATLLLFSVWKMALLFTQMLSPKTWESCLIPPPLSFTFYIYSKYPVSTSKIYLNPSTFLHTHGQQASPSCCHLLPEWLKSLTGVLAFHSCYHYHLLPHQYSGWQNTSLVCLKPSNDFLLLSGGKKILLLLPTSQITSQTIFCVTHWALDTLTSLPQKCQVISHSRPLHLLYPSLVMFSLDFLSLSSRFFSDILFPIFLLNDPFTSFIAFLTM